jgi:hypothetical protein
MCMMKKNMLNHIGCRRFRACSTHGVSTDYQNIVIALRPEIGIGIGNSPWLVQVLGARVRNLSKFQCLGTKAALCYLLRICGTGGKILAAIFVRDCTFCKFFCLIYSTHMRNAHVLIFLQTRSH